MTMIYDLLKSKKPKYIGIKKRENNNILIVSSNDLEIYYLNETAKIIINFSEGRKTIDEIKCSLLNDFEVNEKELENDLIDLIRTLQWKNLIILE